MLSNADALCLFTSKDRLDTGMLCAAFDRPDLGVKRMPVNGLLFGAKLPHVVTERGRFYDDKQFFVRFSYAHIYIRANPRRTEEGWYWSNELYARYSDLKSETLADIYRILRDNNVKMPWTEVVDDG